MNSRVLYHSVAFLTVIIWGSTFVFTKLLLQAGLSPAQIFTLRFIIAYVLLVAYQLLVRRSSHTVSFLSKNWRDELLMVVFGLFGGSVYFLTENAAMLYTTATNTSLIVCSCPLFTMLLVALFYRHSERFSKLQVFGSVLACVGMAVVVLNGHFVLHLSPKGDLLAFAACICWAVYSLLMKSVIERYDAFFITRKLFFYGLLTIIPYYLVFPEEASLFTASSLPTLFSWPILLNLLFLGVIASMLCFVVWNWVIGKLGPVVATNWVYFNPLTTIVFAWWLLNEPITSWLLLGTILILVGMYLCERRKS